MNLSPSSCARRLLSGGVFPGWKPAASVHPSASPKNDARTDGGEGGGGRRLRGECGADGLALGNLRGKRAALPRLKNSTIPKEVHQARRPGSLTTQAHNGQPKFPHPQKDPLRSAPALPSFGKGSCASFRAVHPALRLDGELTTSRISNHKTQPVQHSYENEPFQIPSPGRVAAGPTRWSLS